MTIVTDIQIACSEDELPSHSDIESWVCETLDQVSCDSAELTLRIVDESEITSLNHKYRSKKQATDVLAFTVNFLPQFDPTPLGDIVVCAKIVNEQSDNLEVPRKTHWARIVSHGVLHLCGFDHRTDDEAKEMEGIENSILQNLGLANFATN